MSSRLGWTTLTADPETGTVYAHTTGGFLFALDPNDGKELWSHQLTEEYGRVTGYGGRIVSPVYDSGLVIIGTPTSGWGDQARGQGRFVAFDAKTGEVVWWSSPTDDFKAPASASAAPTTRSRSSPTSVASGCLSRAGPTAASTA